ncbi:HAAS signaling domain-containing protein [Streptomyces sp. NPDC006463]|uniref:HAAS signaling domain-containing protein n=1 Tax=Streptomyces sp. NPDC006463 TaxID=3364746 RepID=UPI0036A6A14D
MKAEDHPLVRQYLATVEREAAALPADRRNELLADLVEHIAVSTAEGSAHDADTLRALLEQLGDPRTIVATALHEEPSTPPRGFGRPVAAVVPLTASALLWVAAAPVAALLWLVGLTLLWRARYWTTGEKQVATAATALLPAACVLRLLGIVSPGNLGPAEVLLLLVAMAVVPAVIAGRLLKAARRRLA